MIRNGKLKSSLYSDNPSDSGKSAVFFAHLAERDLTFRDLAQTAGRLGAQMEQTKSLEQRALSAELRLEKGVKRRAKPQKRQDRLKV